MLVSKVWRPLTLWVRMVCGSDDLHDLTQLKEAVKDSEVLVLLQSFRVLERLYSDSNRGRRRSALLTTFVCLCKLSCGSHVGLVWLSCGSRVALCVAALVLLTP